MRMSEFDLIQRFFNRSFQRSDVVLGIGDDAALLQVPPGQQLVAAVDTLVAGRHFPVSTTPFDIGYKALAVNLSDLAAMGAEPAWATLALTMPEASERWLEEFARGFFCLADEYQLALIGGDTTQGPLSITVQVHGFVQPDKVLRRDAAHIGQRIFVTGTPGDAALALRELQQGKEPDADLLQRLNRPQPRVDLGQKLAGIANAAIDVSDGLLADLGHIVTASDCGAQLSVERLPVSETLQALGLDDRLGLQLAGGDDYELCFTVDEMQIPTIRQLAHSCRIEITEVGIIVDGSGVRCMHADGSVFQLSSGGFEHFSEPL